MYVFHVISSFFFFSKHFELLIFTLEAFQTVSSNYQEMTFNCFALVYQFSHVLHLKKKLIAKDSRDFSGTEEAI